MNEQELRQIPLSEIPNDFLSGEEQNDLSKALFGWKIIEQAGVQLRREFVFTDFSSAVDFVDHVKELVANRQHVPAVVTIMGDGNVVIEWHAPARLRRNDFVMAAHTNHIYDRWGTLSGDGDILDRALESTFPASDPRPVGSRIE